MSSLTVNEAHERSTSLVVSSYRVDRDLTAGDEIFRPRRDEYVFRAQASRERFGTTGSGL